MEVCSPVKLQPQRWLPDGKQWIQVFPDHGFDVGDRLVGNVDCDVVKVMETSIRLDRKVSRKEAASLAKVIASLDPAVWGRFFFTGWSEFWQWEQDFDESEPWKALLEFIPGVEQHLLPPVTFADWSGALAKAKVTTMRGKCGWSVGELKMVPAKAVEPLLRLFELIEKGGCWPKQLQTWLLVLLRQEDGIPTWKSVRPISGASVVYRMWARIRTFQLLQVCHGMALPTMGPRLSKSTRSLWVSLQTLWRKKMPQVILQTVGSPPCMSGLLELFRGAYAAYKLCSRPGFRMPNSTTELPQTAHPAAGVQSQSFAALINDTYRQYIQENLNDVLTAVGVIEQQATDLWPLRYRSPVQKLICTSIKDARIQLENLQLVLRGSEQPNCPQLTPPFSESSPRTPTLWGE
eukprot:s840_g28.t1